MIFENTTLVYKVGGNTKTNLYFKTKIQDVLYNALLSILVKFQKNSTKTRRVSVISKVVSLFFFFGPPDINQLYNNLTITSERENYRDVKWTGFFLLKS